ncbi:Oxalate--CoA ligase [Spatholobus suberectus]|nr:Oxalate--CoA ligase [Spatholobus suberectus]
MAARVCATQRFADGVRYWATQRFVNDTWFVRCGGEKISPIEVDVVLLSHPDIAQAAAFGVPDYKYGEENNTKQNRIKGFLPATQCWKRKPINQLVSKQKAKRLALETEAQNSGC